MASKLSMTIALWACLCAPAWAERVLLAYDLPTHMLWPRENLYRWTDPVTGNAMATQGPPPYPIKAQRQVGTLPRGVILELTLETETPRIKELIAKQKAQLEQKQRDIEEARQFLKKQQEQQAEEKQKLAEQKRQREEYLAAAAKQAAEQEAKLKAARAEEKAKLARQQAKEAAENAMIQQKIAAAEARKGADEDLRFMLDVVKEFKIYDEFAAIAPKAGLPPALNKLEEIRARLGQYHAAGCYDASLATLKTWMAHTLSKYHEYQADRMSIALDFDKMAGGALKTFWSNLPDSCRPWWRWW